MKCPVCNDVRMREVVKDDVLIDVCPDCKGVRLDRGELEKLMQGVREVRRDYERMEKRSVYEQPRPEQDYGQYRDQHHGQDKGSYGYDKHGRPYKKKKTVLDVFGDLFD